MPASVRTARGIPCLHASSKTSRQVTRSAQADKRDPIVFKPASQTCPPERFTRADKYDNPYKKELPVGHWNSQYLDDPDAWWGDSDSADFSGGSSGGSGGRGRSGWGDDDFEDDDDYDLSVFPLGILVLGLGAVSSGLASGCIVYESTVLAANTVTGPPRLPSSLYLPVSKRMLWFRKHGNPKMSLGFAQNAWIWLLLGLASAAAAFIKRRSRQPEAEEELPQPLLTEESELEKALLEEDELQSVHPEISYGETLAPVSTATDSEELCVSTTTKELVRLPDPVESGAAVSDEPETNDAPTAEERSTETPCEASEADSEGDCEAQTNDLEPEAAVDRVGTPTETPRSAREQLDSARCHPGARFWKHKSINPSGSRSVQALDVEGDELDNTTYNSAQNFWKQQTAAVQAANAAASAPLLDMSVEAVAARQRAARSCCFATNQRPQVPRLRGIPPGPLGPNTPDGSASTSKRQNDSERSLVSERQQAFERWLQPQGSAQEFRQRTISDSSASSRGSLRKAFSSNYRPSSIMNSNRTLPSPSTPDPTEFVRKPWGTIRGLDTIESCPEADSGALTTSSMDSEWTLSADNAVYDEGTSSDGLSDCDMPSESEDSEDVAMRDTKAATAPLPNVVFEEPDDAEERAAREEIMLMQASSQPLQDAQHSPVEWPRPQHDTDNSRVLAQHSDARADMFSDSDSLDSVENASTYAYDGPVDENEDDKRSSASSVSAKDLSAPLKRNSEDHAPLKNSFEEDRELMCNAAGSKRVSERSNACSQHSQQSQHSLSLSAEALIFESSDDPGNNPLFWETTLDQQASEAAAAPVRSTGFEEPSPDLFRRISGDQPGRRSSDSRARGMSTRGSLPEQEMESLDLVQASASCMLEQQVQCLVGTRYVNPLPLLTVNRSASQSPAPSARGGREYALTTPGSPGASSRSSGSSMHSVLADALRSAQRDLAGVGSQQPVVAPADAHEVEGTQVHVGRLSCEEPCRGWHEQRIQQIDMAEKRDAGDADALDDLASDAAHEPVFGARARRHIFSQVETLHARSRPASPDHSRARTAHELHSGASLLQKSDQEGDVGSEVAMAHKGVCGADDFAGTGPGSDRRSASTTSDSSGTPNFFAYPSHVE